MMAVVIFAHVYFGHRGVVFAPTKYGIGNDPVHDLRFGKLFRL